MAFSKDKAHDRAEKYAARGQHDRAAREYQAIVEHDPKDVRAWLMLADSLARTGDRAGAVSRYQQVGDFYASSREFQKALAVYRQVLNLDPSRLDIHYKCAQLNMEVGRVHDAIASFESIAQSQLQSGRVAEALQTYRTIADADPTVVSKRLRLAELYSREKMVDDAVEAFRQAATILLEAGRHSDYVRVAERLIYHKPDERDVVRELARVYLHLGDARRALMKLNGLLQADPGDAAGLELLAETFMALGKPDKASSVIVELVKKLREGGDEDGAGRALEMGLDWIPHDPELLALQSSVAPRAAPTPAPQPTPVPAPAPEPIPEPVEEVTSDAVDFELDDADVVELDDGDFELEGSSADVEVGHDDIDLDFDTEPDPEPEPAASTSMTDHVLEEVSQSSARGQDFGLEGADPDSLTDGDKLLFEARVYVKYRLFDHALEHLDPLLAQRPDHVPALSLRARSLTELERMDEAASTHAQIAALVEGGDPKLAREHVQAALQAVPRHPAALAVQSRLENDTPAPADIVDFDEAIADDALDLLDDDDIAIDVAEPEPEPEQDSDTHPIVVENRFGISEAGPLPEADSNAGIALSIAPTEQMQALQRARSNADKTPPTAFIPRHPTVEMDTGGPAEQVPTEVDIAGSRAAAQQPPAADPSMSDLLDDDDSGSIDIGLETPAPFDPASSSEPTTGPQPVIPDAPVESFGGPEPELELEPELEPDLEVELDPEPEPSIEEAVLDTLEVDTPEDSADGGDDGFDAEFDAAFDDGFDELLDANAPEPVLQAAPPVTAPTPSPAPPTPEAPEAPEPPGGWADLSDELAEIRFYLDQGLDDDAEAELEDLWSAHPGHPEVAKMRGELSGAQAPPVAQSTGAAPLVDLDEEADEDAYLSAIFGGGDDSSGPSSSAPQKSSSGGASAKAQDVEGAGARDRFDLGMAYREMGLVDSAVTEFEAACTDPTWESRARVMLGALRVLQGNIELAVADLQRASEVAGNDEERSSAAYELALVHEKTGNNDAAIQLLEGVAPGFRERDAKLATLRG